MPYLFSFNVCSYGGVVNIPAWRMKVFLWGLNHQPHCMFNIMLTLYVYCGIIKE